MTYYLSNKYYVFILAQNKFLSTCSIEVYFILEKTITLCTNAKVSTNLFFSFKLK